MVQSVNKFSEVVRDIGKRPISRSTKENQMFELSRQDKEKLNRAFRLDDELFDLEGRSQILGEDTSKEYEALVTEQNLLIREVLPVELIVECGCKMLHFHDDFWAQYADEIHPSQGFILD